MPWWWDRPNPPVFAQDAQWAELRRALDRTGPSHWLRVRQENAARAAELLAQSKRLLADSEHCLRETRQRSDDGPAT